MQREYMQKAQPHKSQHASGAFGPGADLIAYGKFRSGPSEGGGASENLHTAGLNKWKKITKIERGGSNNGKTRWKDVKKEVKRSKGSKREAQIIKANKKEPNGSKRFSKWPKMKPKSTKREPKDAKGSHKGAKREPTGAKRRPKCIHKSIFVKGRENFWKCHEKGSNMKSGKCHPLSDSYYFCTCR